MVSTSSFSKQVVIFLLVLSFLNPAYASNALGGWSMSNPVAQGASVLYNGAKNVIINGANVAKTSTALITPTATSVAKLLGKGVAGVALSVAVEQLLGAVDWVLDPANNQIVYTPPSDSSLPPNVQKYYQVTYADKYYYGSTKNQACDAYLSAIIGYGFSTSSVTDYNPSGQPNSCFIKKSKPSAGADHFSLTPTLITNPNYDPTLQPQRKTLPLSPVAAQVISNAESNTDKRAAAQVATMAAAADIVAEAESDNVKARPIVNQLDANAKTETDADANTATGSQTQNPTKPETTDLKLEFPKFCGWAPIVCEAAQVAIAFPRLVTGWWGTIVEKTNSWATSISQSWAAVKEEYADKPKENTDTKLDIPDVPTSAPDTTLNFGGSCPAPLSAPYSFFGLSGAIEFSFDPVCQIASFIKPVVISVAAFSSVLIVAGIRTEDD